MEVILPCVTAHGFQRAFFLQTTVIASLYTCHAPNLEFIGLVLEVIDIVRILVDLILQRAQFIGILSGEFVEYGLVAKADVVLLHCLCDDCCHLITRHGAAALEGTIPHTFNDALFGEVIECLIGPVILRHIREAVRRSSKCCAGHPDRQAGKDSKCFRVDLHVIDFLSLLR